MKTLMTLLLLFLVQSALADDRSVAIDYLTARGATLARGATAADVDKALGFLADDAVVEHPRFNAVVSGREAIRRGMVSHLSDYTGTPAESGIVVLGSLESPGAIAFRTRTTFVTGDGARRQVVTREGIMLLEIRDGRIARVIEY